MLWCNHKFGKVEGGYQYCDKCGKAVSAPKKECAHKWNILGKYTTKDRFTNSILSYEYAMQCQICGDIKKEEIK